MRLSRRSTRSRDGRHWARWAGVAAGAMWWATQNCCAAAQFWLATSGRLPTGAQAPTNVAEIPQNRHGASDMGGTLYLWGRPDAGKTLQNWSLLVVAADASVVQLSISDVETFNPLLGAIAGRQVRRWEYHSEPVASPPTTKGTSELKTLQGFSLIGDVEDNGTPGIGIGPQGAGGIVTDPYAYHGRARTSTPGCWRTSTMC